MRRQDCNLVVICNSSFCDDAFDDGGGRSGQELALGFVRA